MEPFLFAFTGMIYPFFLVFVLIKNIRQIHRLNIGKLSWQEIKIHNWVEFVFIIVAPITGIIKLSFFFSLNDSPFALPYAYALIPIYIVSSLSFYISKYSLFKESLLVYWICRAGMVQGIIFCIVLSIHFCFYTLLGIIFPLYGFELSAPILIIVYFIKELKRSRLQMLSTTESDERIIDRSINPLPHLLRASLTERSLIIISLLASLVATEELIILMSGLSPFSPFLAFTVSRGFLFSYNFF